MATGGGAQKGSMSGRVCLITGANSGIGKAAALGLARLGAQIVMVCRDDDRGEAARAEIVAKTGNDQVSLMQCELSSQASVRKFAAEFKSRHKALHVLINNAGVELWYRMVTIDGHETTFAVNHLAPYLLSHLLLDLMKESAPARIINVSSMVHRLGKIDFHDIEEQLEYNPNKAYYQSKLAMVMFTYGLAARLEGSGVTVNALEPGVVNTGFFRDFQGLMRVLIGLYRPFMRSSAKGAETVIHLASAPEVGSVSGKYFRNKHAVATSKASHDEATAKRLWQISAEMTGLAAPPPGTQISAPGAKPEPKLSA